MSDLNVYLTFYLFNLFSGIFKANKIKLNDEKFK